MAFEVNENGSLLACLVNKELNTLHAIASTDPIKSYELFKYSAS